MPYLLSVLEWKPSELPRFFVCAIMLMFFSGVVRGIEFNTEMLDINDRKNIDLGQFSKTGFIMPGLYIMQLRVNQAVISEQEVSFYASEDDPLSSKVCLSPAIVEQLELKRTLIKELVWWRKDQCLDLASLPGVEARGELSSSTLFLGIPQAYLEYSSPDWDPPSRWDEGIAGLVADYSFNSIGSRSAEAANSIYSSGNGTLGANLGRWRLRADWQAQERRQSAAPTHRSFGWSRYYGYTAVPGLLAKLTLGDMYLDSRVFDSFRYVGMGLSTDDSMLPPNLRGYAPEVVGLAKTNAKVTVSQMGRVLYETQVPAGPFHIRDIHDSVTGKLDVKVEELDGTVQEFDLETASIPYLTRPGSIRYKVAIGDIENNRSQKFFGGEFSWGINNGWSLYGGSLISKGYNAESVGIGRDLLAWGAMSLDVTQSTAQLANQKSLSGRSYRVSYSKTFEEYDSQVTFAGYRFSDENFRTMNDYLASYDTPKWSMFPEDQDAYQLLQQSNKALYSVILNKQFREAGMGVYLNYNRQTYWTSAPSSRYSLSTSKYFNIGRVKNISLSLSAYKQVSTFADDVGAYASVSMPLGASGTTSYNTSVNSGKQSHGVSYYERLGRQDNYQLSAGTSPHGESFSGYYSHDGESSELSVNTSHQPGEYTSIGISAQGGGTLSVKGGAFHRSNGMGGATRLLVDTSGVADVPVKGNSGISKTNRFGKAVITDITRYYRTAANIELGQLPEHVEVVRSVAEAVLTEGAIGYRTFDIVSGEKAMAQIRLQDGTLPPFGATMFNQQKQELGIVADDGAVYLTGLNPGQTMSLHWDGIVQCIVNLPKPLSVSNDQALTLLCVSDVSG